MSTETMQDRHRSTEERLAALGRRIDDVRRNARYDREKVDRSIERRVDAVRAKDAEIRTELRQMAEEDEAAWNAYLDELDRELVELDAEVDVVESRLAAADAEDQADFERAIQEELDAYDRMLEAFEERVARTKAEARRRSTEAVDRVREKAQTAGERVGRVRADAARPWKSMRDEISADMDALDAAMVEAFAVLDADLMDGGSDDER